MAWRDRLQQGSFRGVPFHTESNTYTGGRRQVVHEFPGKEQGFIEDNGRRDGSHAMQLYVIGNDYDLARDSLQQALESKVGAGTLIHPRKGSLLVVVSEFSITETTAEQGMARFEVTFLEAQQQPQPTANVDTQASVASAADAALEASKASFVADFTVDGLPEFVADSSKLSLGNLVSKLRNVNGRLSAAQQPISEFFSDIDALGDELGALIRQPADLANRIVGGIGALSGVLNDVNAAIAVYENLSKIIDPPSPAFNTPSRLQEQKNLQAINKLQAQAAAVESARATSVLSYDSYQQATQVRNSAAALLDTQMLSADDEAYVAMRELRSKAVKDIASRGGDLARIDKHTPIITGPALVLAYQLHGDYQREDDIIARNGIDHPGFIQGGQSLEVLIDV